MNTLQRKREILVGRLEHEILLALVKPRFLGSNNAFRRHPLFLRWLHIKLPLLELQWAGEVCCFFQPRVFTLTLTHNLLARVSFLSTPCGRQLHHDSRSFVFAPSRSTSIEAKYNTEIIPFHINFTTWTGDSARCFQAKKFSNRMRAWIFPFKAVQSHHNSSCSRHCTRIETCDIRTIHFIPREQRRYTPFRGRQICKSSANFHVFTNLCNRY